MIFFYFIKKEIESSVVRRRGWYDRSYFGNRFFYFRTRGSETFLFFFIERD